MSLNCIIIQVSECQPETCMYKGSHPKPILILGEGGCFFLGALPTEICMLGISHPSGFLSDLSLVTSKLRGITLTTYPYTCLGRQVTSFSLPPTTTLNLCLALISQEYFSSFPPPSCVFPSFTCLLIPIRLSASLSPGQREALPWQWYP